MSPILPGKLQFGCFCESFLLLVWGGGGGGGWLEI